MISYTWVEPLSVIAHKHLEVLEIRAPVTASEQPPSANITACFRPFFPRLCRMFLDRLASASWMHVMARPGNSSGVVWYWSSNHGTVAPGWLGNVGTTDVDLSFLRTLLRAEIG